MLWFEPGGSVGAEKGGFMLGFLFEKLSKPRDLEEEEEEEEELEVDGELLFCEKCF
tara:strand:- start:448 stop:615 length:168 start_codon:yes stop_codon:yes gene_type:complete